ncbi:uncharacterized protein LOC110849744 isoform X2 [Folsomia candida]|uniref:uncharacterized protein LOC110849744 isoform X2 n=1 Tax=Folsomia candida TaxID=158441 RepID=UPI000B90161E|nr:uncharacterized protein LOC110849744 isoform X2 [Folsomia candida]
MYSVTIIFLLVTLLANSTADDGSISTSNYVYIGQPDSERKLFFASISELPWFDGMDNCNVHGFIPGRISDEMQHSFIKNFLQTTTLFPQGPGSLWLPATDHIEEGTFRWLENYGEVNVGTRSEGMPSGNRSANCLLINQDGLYREDSCHAYVPHHVLCEVPLLKYARPEADKTYYSKLGDKLAGVGGPSSIIPTDQSLVKIGRVGNIRYFVDEDPSDTKGWLENWDLCHENAMRLAAPESMEEYYFLRNYSMREEMAGRWNLFHIGASDILSVSCGKGNTYPRWVHNGNAVTSDPNLVDAGHSHRFSHHNSWDGNDARRRCLPARRLLRASPRLSILLDLQSRKPGFKAVPSSAVLESRANGV